ncbi:MAG TPA: protein kinase [Vicinamibacterales bacterium]|nr:protein kinase [Vicinamibacterales bacterium]
MPPPERHVLIGTTLGRYQITAALGAGGMGEVYRATDLTLGREVAIKLLPDPVAADPERLARFRREARVLASLNHPNIAAIYGFEEIEGRAFLTLELVEGEDLAKRLRRGPIPVTEALEIARQVAEALEAAHERGVIHRDLKPANLTVTASGVVKVLDFGLAKAWSGEPAGSDPVLSPSLSPTFAGAETGAGVILGTAAYMAPEQARGRVVDRRADVWAFGVVLYEMLTGRAAFSGETVTDVIAAVMRAEPNLAALPPDTPPAVRRLLRRCLQKDPRVRLPDVGAARVELSEVLAGDLETAGPARTGRTRVAAWLLACAAMLGAGVAGGYRVWGRGSSAPSPPLIHVRLETPASFRLDQLSYPVISPDGRHIVISALTEGRQRLWIRRLDSLAFEPLEGTDGALLPFWSSDSRHVAFAVDRHLKRVSLDGGGAQTIASLDSGFFGGGAWHAQGFMVVSKGVKGQRQPVGATLVKVDVASGRVEPVTVLDEAREEFGHFRPQFLPDGQHIAFGIGSSNPDHDGVFVLSLDDPAERRLLLADRSIPAFALGHMLFVRGTLLTAQPFDAESLSLHGEPRAIADNVGMFVGAGIGYFSTAESGLTVYAGLVPTETRLAWVARNGTRQAEVGPLLPYGQIALSPDGRQAAVELPDDNGEFDLWVLDLARGVSRRLTFARGDDRDPVWSPDGTQILFTSDREDGVFRLFRKRLAGGEEGPLFQTRQHVYPESWTPDGAAILYQDEGRAGEGGRVGWRWRLDGRTEPEAILKLGFSIDELQISPGGRLLAYISAESGSYEVYVETLAGPKTKVRVSTEGGGQPKWRRDGRELYFTSGGRLHAVEVRQVPELQVGLPVPLFELTAPNEDFDDYSPSADGQRFLVKQRSGDGTSPTLHLLINWHLGAQAADGN